MMNQGNVCTHISDISDSATTIGDVVNTKEKYGCNNCQNTGPNLWLCLQDNCFQLGCSESVNDHSTLHNKDNPTHHIQLNLCTSKLWCYACAQEVFLLPTHQPDLAASTKAARTISFGGDGEQQHKRSYSDACVHRMEQEEEEDEGEEADDDEEDVEAEAEDDDEDRMSTAVGRKRRGAVTARGRVTVDHHASGGDSSDDNSDNPSLPEYSHQFSTGKFGSSNVASSTTAQKKQQHTYIADTDDSDSSPTHPIHIHSTHLYQKSQQHPVNVPVSPVNKSTTVRGGLVGLANIGNTCYMNAALQALSNTKPLTGFFLECQQAVHSLSEGRKPGLSRTYQVLMRDMWLGRRTGGYVTPSGILCGIRNVHAMFRGFQQHDTQEFLRNFMDQLHEELKQELIVHPPPSPAPPPYSKYAESKIVMNGVAVGSPTSSSGISAHAHSSYGGTSSCGGGGSPSSNYDSSDGEEYETCDSGVSERSSLSEDTDRSPMNIKGGSTGVNIQQLHKRRLSRSGSPGRRMRARKQNNSGDQQSTINCSTSSKPPPIKYRSIISDIFDGKLLSSVQCLTCDRVSSRVETFQDLSLPIPSSRDHLVVIHGRSVSVGSSGTSGPSLNCASTTGGSMMDQPSSVSSLLPALLPPDGWLSWLLAWLRSWFYGPAVSLHDCLAAFFSRDELKGDNMYSCERCNKLRNGIKYSKVLQLPEVLCIHLKRFRHELMYSSKISAAVAFPLHSLDMRPYLHERCSSTVTTYHLFAVICHHGTAGGGHYTCYALNNGQWYEFDDQYVTATTPDQVAQCQAYVLFYGKCTAQADQLKSAAMTLSLDTPSSATRYLAPPPLGHDCSACSVNATATGTKPHLDIGCGADKHGVESVQSEIEKAAADPPPRRCYVSNQWLSRFKTCAEPGPIDNSDFLCRHGNVDPLREGDLDKLATVFPAQVYEYLLDRFGGCPLIPCYASTAPNQSSLVCAACIAVHHRINEETDKFLALNEAWKRSGDHHHQHMQHQLTHFLSTNWFGRWQAWVQRRAPEPPGPIDNGGRLLQGQVVYDDCAEVNEAIWLFFYDIYGGGPDVQVASVAPSDDNLRQSYVRYNHASGNNSVANSESESEHQEEDEDDDNNAVLSTTIRDNHQDHMDEQEQANHADVEANDSMDIDDMPQFVIPALRRDITTSGGSVNKRLYGRGEPEQVQVPDMEIETGLCNGDAAMLENHSSVLSGMQMQTAHPLTTEAIDGQAAEKSSENTRYRRRRMRDT